LHTNSQRDYSVLKQILRSKRTANIDISPNRCYQAGTTNITTTIAKDGLSWKEIIRINAASHELKRVQKKGLKFIYLVLGDNLLEMTAQQAYATMRSFQNYLMKILSDKGFPKLWLNVVEVSGGVHANYFFIGDEALAKKLADKYNQFCKNGVGRGRAIQILNEESFESKIRYVCKERSTQTNLMQLPGYPQRIRKSHLIEGGVDRVRLSKALKKEVLQRHPNLTWRKSLYKQPRRHAESVRYDFIVNGSSAEQKTVSGQS